MTVGVAIRRMARLPRPRDRKLHWFVLGVVAAVVLLIELIADVDWQARAITGELFAAVALFVGLGRLWGWIALSVALGILVGLVPLFGVLGLELSLVTALFASLAGADLGCGLARELGKLSPVGLARATYPTRALLRGCLGGAGLAIAVALIPGVIACVRGLFTPTCDWWFGVTSYIAMPLASAALAGAVGHALGALTGPRRFGPAFLAQLPALIVAITALIRFWAAPPVYTYNALLGYFPGNMYDEYVTLQTPLAWSRLEQLGWVLFVIGLVAWRFDVASYRVRRSPRPGGHRIAPLVLAVCSAVGSVALRCNGGDLGFAVDSEDLEEALGGRLETKHFIIYYSPTTDILADLPLIAEDHEFRYAQVTSQLGVEPDHKIVSFLFADRDQKARLHGSRDVEMAKPWRGEIYLDYRRFPHSSLRHEIAHVIAAEFGDPLFGVATRRILGLPVLAVPGLIEGLAVAVDWPGQYERPNPHESVRILQKLDKLPSLDTLFSLQFFSVSPNQGYATAGSFLRYLLDRHGAAKLRELYRTGGDFERAYGVSREQLEEGWRTMLSTIDIPDSVVESQKERFRRTSVFARPCAHAVAKRFARAERLFGTGDHAGAIDVMREVCSETLEEPGYRLKLGDYLYSDDSQRDEATTIWQLVAIDDRGVTVSLRAQALRRLVRAAAARGDLATAARLLDYARALPLDLDERRELDAMALSLAHTGPAGPHLRAYFFPKEKDPPMTVSAAAAAIAEPSLGLAHYLLGLQRANAGDPVGAAASLEAALARELPGVGFVKNAARQLAIAAYRTHDVARLGLAASVLSGSAMSSGDRLLAKDWLDRAAFDERRTAR